VSRNLHSVGYPGTLEGRVFDFLANRAGVEVCEACKALRYLHCDSVRSAMERLAKRGAVAIVKAGQATFFCVVRNAQRPDDRRGRAATQQMQAIAA